MANDFPTLADLVADALDLADFEKSEVLNAAPLTMSLPAVASSNGDTHKYPVYTQAPVVGFRAENVGRDFDHSVDSIVTEMLKILDFSWAADKAVADRWRKGGAGAYIAREGMRNLGAALFKYEQQFIRGTGANAAGFEGLEDSTFLDAVADDMVYDVTGTTANTASSVYLIRVGPASCASVYHGEANLADAIEDPVVQNFVDGAGGNLPIYYTAACLWTGAQFGAKYDAARVANVTEDVGKGLTDDVLYEAAALFPAGMGPTHVVMNRRSQKQLRASRTATNQTGAPAPRPTTVLEGVPIVVTDAIISTEPILA